MVLALRDALSLGAVSLTRQGLVSTPRSIFPPSFHPLFLSGVLWCSVVHAALSCQCVRPSPSSV
jgi:hypothetical protein